MGRDNGNMEVWMAVEECLGGGRHTSCGGGGCDVIAFDQCLVLDLFNLFN